MQLKRRRILLICMAIGLMAGCHRRPAVVAVAATPIPVTPPIPPVTVVIQPPLIVVAAPPANSAPVPIINVAPLVPPYVVVLEAADREFARAEYAAAAFNYQEYLQQVPTGGSRDKALFHLGLIYALNLPALQDWARATEYFNQLSKEAPEAPYTSAAQLIQSLRRQTVQLISDTAKRDDKIRQLNLELERLVKIDSDRRPRTE